MYIFQLPWLPEFILQLHDYKLLYECFQGKEMVSGFSYISVHILTHIHTHLHTQTCTHSHTHTCTHILTHTHTHTRTHTHTHTHTHTGCAQQGIFPSISGRGLQICLLKAWCPDWTNQLLQIIIYKAFKVQRTSGGAHTAHLGKGNHAC